MDAEQSFKTFENLEVYKAARELRKMMYAVARALPDIEKFGLANQIRRAAVSLTNNIAEGHGRWHYLDQIRFQLQARGSLEELLDDVNACADEKYVSPTTIAENRQKVGDVRKLINGYLRYLRDKNAGKSAALHEETAAYGNSEDDLEAWLSTLQLT